LTREPLRVFNSRVKMLANVSALFHTICVKQ
jgi:hypothetical protein